MTFHFQNICITSNYYKKIKEMKNKAQTVFLLALIAVLLYGLYYFLTEYNNGVSEVVKNNKGEFVTTKGYDLGEDIEKTLKACSYMFTILGALIGCIIGWMLRKVTYNIFPKLETWLNK